MWTLGTPAIEIVIRSAIIYAVFFGALRVFGKREIGQFTLFDLALILLAANALQPAMTGPDQSITGGLIIVATIFILNRGVAALRAHSPLVRRLLEFAPTVVGRDGAWLLPVLVRQGLDLIDVEAALREPGGRWSDQHRRYGSRGEIRKRAPTASLSPAALTGPGLRQIAQRRRP